MIKRRFDPPNPDVQGVLILTLTLNGQVSTTRIDNAGARTVLEAAGKVGVDY